MEGRPAQIIFYLYKYYLYKFIHPLSVDGNC